MKKLFTCLAICLLSVTTLATPIGPMNYQGRLLNDNGIPVTGVYSINVRIFDASVGGVQLYYEEHSSVFVNDGVYSFRVDRF